MQSRLSRTPGALVISATLAATVAACDAQRTTAPPAANATLVSARASRLQAALDDASTRLAPALAEGLGERSQALADQLASLQAHLASGDASRAGVALSSARETLAHVAGTPDAAAIALALDQVAAVLAPDRQ